MKKGSTKPIDYYEMLGIHPEASPDEIKQAYRKKLKEWHPDKNAHRMEAAEEMTKTLNQAYSVLRDPERRKQYDRVLRYTRGKDFGPILDEAGFWQKVEKASPALKQILENLRDLYAMFRDSVKGQYRLPPMTMGIIGGGLLYFIIPLDVVPDYLPIIGYLDDFAVLSAIINSLQGEIDKYRRWKYTE